MEFAKLEKVDFSGIKASSLFDVVQQVFAEFQDQVTVFSQSSYDPLDTESTVERRKKPP